VKEVRKAWTQRRRRSAVPMVVPGRGGEGRADGAAPGHFDVEEEQGADVEAHAEDAEEEWAPTGMWQGNERVRV
jgi:hypothetical protein